MAFGDFKQLYLFLMSKKALQGDLRRTETKNRRTLTAYMRFGGRLFGEIRFEHVKPQRSDCLGYCGKLGLYWNIRARFNDFRVRAHKNAC
jgi:hypothetical protein